MLEGVQGRLLALTPSNEAQRWLHSRALQIGGELAEDRWLLAVEIEGSVPRPFLAALVLWLTILFTAFGLFAPRHATVVVALLVCALSLSAAIFLILEMDRPFDGFVTVSAEPMQSALTDAAKQTMTAMGSPKQLLAESNDDEVVAFLSGGEGRPAAGAAS